MNKFFLMSASKIKVTCTVIINNNSRVKKPVNSVNSFHTTRNQCLAKRVFKRTKRTICRQNSNSVCTVGKIKEELIFAVNFFTTDCRCPGITSPFCRTTSTSNFNNATIGPVYQILRTKDIERIYFIIAVVAVSQRKFCLLSIICTININCIIINKNSRVGIKLMKYSRIIFGRKFYSLLSNQLLKICKSFKSFFATALIFLSRLLSLFIFATTATCHDYYHPN